LIIEYLLEKLREREQPENEKPIKQQSYLIPRQALISIFIFNLSSLCFKNRQHILYYVMLRYINLV